MFWYNLLFAQSVHTAVCIYRAQHASGAERERTERKSERRAGRNSSEREQSGERAWQNTVERGAGGRGAACASAHRGRRGQLTPLGKMDEKLKSENMQKRAVFYVYVTF